MDETGRSANLTTLRFGKVHTYGGPRRADLSVLPL
jgi:hypothetical protein